MSTDLEKESSRRRQANYAARKKGLPEPYPKIDQRIAQKILERHVEDLAWAQAQDAIGYYRSECRSAVKLLGLYEGGGLTEDQDAEVDDDKPKAKKKTEKEKQSRPNPSQTKISIRAVEYNGIKLEPNCDPEFRKLKEVDDIVSFQRWLELRDKGRKDLL